MSDVIETGSMRRRRKAQPPRDESIGRKRKVDEPKKIDMSANELELGHFVGDKDRRPGPDKSSKGQPAGEGEVVGPKRRKRDSAKAKAKTDDKTSEAELSIAAPLTVDEGQPERRPRARRRRRPAANAGWLRLGLLAVLSVVLVALTAATFLFMPRYDVQGDPLIADPAFEAGLGEWTQAGLVSHDTDDPGTIVMESLSADQQTYLRRDFALPADKTMVVLRAQVQGEEVVTGPEIWDSARIYFVRLDSAGKPDWSEEHNLFNMNGTTKVRNYRRAFTIPAEFDSAQLGIEMKNATGRLTVTELELTVVEYRTTFMAALGALLVAWSVVVIYTGIKTFGGINSSGIKISLGVVCALSVIALMLPGSIHQMAATSLNNWLGIDNGTIDTLGHSIMFTVLAFLVRLGRPSDPLPIHVGAWLLIAIASEVLQLFTFDRDPSLRDLWVDGFGIVLGLTLAEGIIRVRRLRVA
ncbi:MAG: VanZ family protein [Pseudomonadota bacterium]